MVNMLNDQVKKHAVLGSVLFQSKKKVVYGQVQPVDDSAFFDYATWSTQRAVASFEEAHLSFWVQEGVK